MFKSGNAELSGDDAGGFVDALLFFAGNDGVIFFPGGVDLLAGLGRGGGEGENASGGAGFKRGEHGVGRAGHDLEADLFFAHSFSDGRGDDGGHSTGEDVGGDEAGHHGGFGFGEHHAAGESGEDGGDEDAAPGGGTGGGDERDEAVEAAGGILHADDVGMVGEFGNEIDGKLAMGEFGDAVEDDGEGRAVGEGAVVGDHAAGGGIQSVIGRVVHGGTDEDGVVLKLGGICGEAESFREAFAADAGEEDFVGAGGGGDVAEDVAGFLIAEHDGFAGGSKDDEAGAGGAGVALDVMFELAQVEAAVGIERSGDCREDAFEKHGTIVMIQGGGQGKSCCAKSEGTIVLGKDANRSVRNELAARREPGTP
jgi:hypothetical protein